MLGLDYAAGRPGGAAIKAAGYDFVVRYLTDGGPGLPGKLLTLDEANDLRANGVDIVSNWETTADRMRAGHDAGVSDAQAALAQVLACGGRPDRPIYFSADWDATPDDQQQIDDYLRGAASVIGADWVGVYGDYYVVGRCLDGGTAKWAWQTDAWSGNQFDARCQLHQRIGTVNIAGIDCDVDEADAPDIGQWGFTPTPAPAIALAAESTPLEAPVSPDPIGDIREQLTGSRITGYAGWPQLGQNPDGTNRTVVDALAAVLANHPLPDLRPGEPSTREGKPAVSTPNTVQSGPTQVRYPWRTTVRTILQLVLGLAAALPILVSATGIPQTAAGVATALAVSGAITRIMAIPAVEAAIALWAPWLATSPAVPVVTAPPGGAA